MTDIALRTDELRRASRMTQRDLAETLGISQAHYSKIAGGVVAPSEALAQRMLSWSDAQERLDLPGPKAGQDVRVRQLSRSIQRQCRQLADLLATGR